VPSCDHGAPVEALEDLRRVLYISSQSSTIHIRFHTASGRSAGIIDSQVPRELGFARQNVTSE